MTQPVSTKSDAFSAVLSSNSLDLTKQTTEKHLMFCERIWGIKDKEKFVFDPQKYSIQDFTDEQNPSEDVILSDTVLKYYSDGTREVVAVDSDPYLFQVYIYGKKHFSAVWKERNRYRDIIWADMDKMLTMFPNDSYIKELDRKYPYLRNNGRFAFDEVDMDNYVLAMPPANGTWIFGHIHNICEKFSSLGGLQKFFKTYVQTIDTKSVEYADQWMSKQGITVYRKDANRAHCRLFVGYTGLPYRVIETILLRAGKSTAELKKAFLKHGEPLNLTLGLNVVSAENFNNFSNYSDYLGCPTSGNFMFSADVFRSWARDLTPQELSVITRERYFSYLNPDMPTKNQLCRIAAAKTGKNGFFSKLKNLVAL